MISQKTKSSLTVIVGTILVIIGTLILVAFASGYNVDLINWEVTSSGLIKLNTNPTGADIKINSKRLNKKTPYQIEGAKLGEITVEYTKEGYHDWLSRYIVSGGEVTFADYALLIPKNIEIKQIDSEIKPVSLFTSADNSKQFATSLNPAIIYEIGRNNQYKKIAEVPINDSLKSPSALTVVGVNLEGSAMLLNASYPDSKAVNFWLNTTNGTFVNIDSFAGTAYSQASIDPRNSKDIFALAAGQIIKLSTENKTISKLAPQNITSLLVDKSYLYVIENNQKTELGQALVRYDHSGNNRKLITELKSASGSVWNLKSSKLTGADFVSMLRQDSTELYMAKIDGDSIATSNLGPGCSLPAFNEKGRFFSYQQSSKLRTIDIEYAERFGTDLSNVTNIGWLTEHQMLISKTDGLYIIDYNGFNYIKIPPEIASAQNLQWSFVRETKTIYFIKDGKTQYYSLQPKNSLINF